LIARQGKPCGKSDSLACLGGHLTAALAIQAANWRRHQTSDQASTPQNGPGALAQTDGSIVARRQAARSIRLPVGNPDRQDGLPGDQRRLDQGRVEVQ